MKIQDNIVEMLSNQFKEELYASYLYFSMSIWANAQKLPGFAQWMDKQAKEELEHAERLHKYITERGGNTILAAIDAPPTDFGTALDCMKAALEHEELVTENFHRMYETAREAGDMMTVSALQWFIDEQVEEEASCTYWVDRLELCDGNKSALLFVDSEMAKAD